VGPLPTRGRKPVQITGPILGPEGGPVPDYVTYVFAFFGSIKAVICHVGGTSARGHLAYDASPCRSAHAGGDRIFFFTRGPNPLGGLAWVSQHIGACRTMPFQSAGNLLADLCLVAL